MVVTKLPTTRHRAYVIQHSGGTTFVPLYAEDGTVSTIPVDRDGQQEEYVTGLRPGDIIYIQGSGVSESSASFDDIRGVLKRNVPAYAEDRSDYFVELGFLDDKTIHETTRLRYDLFHAAASRKPELFTENERNNLDDYVFRRSEENGNRRDFSRSTGRKIADYIATTAKEAFSSMNRDWPYSEKQNSAIGTWLRGNVIHPTNFKVDARSTEDTFWIANALGIGDFERRASEVHNAAELAEKGNYSAKSQNLYFRLTDAHRSVTNTIRGIKGSGGNKDSSGNHDPRHPNIYADMPEWTAVVMEELAPRAENGIIEAQFYSGDLADVPDNTGKEEPHSKGFGKNIVLVREEDGRDEVYKSIGVPQVPRRRKNKLQEDLEGSIETLYKIYRASIPLIVKDYLKYRDSTPGPFVTGKPGGRRVNISLFEFLSPMFSYTPKSIADAYRNEIADILNAVSQNPIDVSSTPTGLLNVVESMYNKSSLLKDVYSSSEELLMSCALSNISTARELISRYGNLGRREIRHVLQNNRRYISRSQHIAEQIKEGNSQEVSKLIEIDSGIPVELIMTRPVESFFWSISDSDTAHFLRMSEIYGINTGRLKELFVPQQEDLYGMLEKEIQLQERSMR